MRKELKEIKHEAKRNELISLFSDCHTFTELSKKMGVTKQCAQQTIKYYGLIEHWNEHQSKCMAKYYDHVPNTPGAVSVFSVLDRERKYYVYSNINIRRAFTSFLYSKKSRVISAKIDDLIIEVIYTGKNPHHIVRQKLLSKNSFDQPIPEGRPAYQANRKWQIKARGNLKKKKSKFKYVTWLWAQQLWRAQPVIDGKQVYMGNFKNEIDAYNVVKQYYKKPKSRKKTVRVF